MNIGMLWFDDNPKASILDKVSRAASYYEMKYGRKPNVCFVHPGMIADGKDATSDGVEIKPSRSILRNHFWLGVQQSSPIN